MWFTRRVPSVVAMTGRGCVVVLWDSEHPPPPGPVLDRAALATTEWDWTYVGPPTPFRPPTMVVERSTEAIEPMLDTADVVIGVPTQWTIEHVAASGARFVAVVLGDASPSADGTEELVVAGWPAADDWPAVLDAAVVLDEGHHGAFRPAEVQELADEIQGLLDEIRERHLPAAFRKQD